MAENKFYTQWWFFVIIGVIILGSIVGFSSNSQTNSISQDTNLTSAEEQQDFGLNDKVELRDLSFKLFNVSLNKWKESAMSTTEINGNIPAKTYNMNWLFEITNNGENIKYVSADCGTLLFEDGSQYKMGNSCKDYAIVPGATIKIYSMFLFSDNFIVVGAKPWEQVPGTKIVYFSEQTGGLVKYTIDKSEIEYTSEI